jgi:hypothetical protein
VNAQLYKIKYINETYWNQIEKKINFENIDKKQFKLCYFLNINCPALSKQLTDPRRLSHHGHIPH